MRLVFGLLLCCVVLPAQFDHLSTNDDGSVIYFSSSLRMRDSGQVGHRKLFVASAASVRLLMQRPLERISSSDATWPVSNYHSLEAVAVDGTGSTVGIVARRDCYGGSGCLPTPKYRTEIRGREYRGQMSLSRNGRYGLLWGDGSMIPAGALVDLESGQSKTWIEYATWRGRYGRRQVSSLGTAVFPRDRTLRIVQFDAERTLPLPDYAFDVTIDDQARTAVYQSADGLYSADLATDELRRLAAGPANTPMQPCISNDGRVVLFVSGAQIFVADPRGTTPRQLFDEPSGVREFVLSGDGRIVYAVTGSGRLLRVAVESGAVDELIGQTASVQATSSSVAPYPVPGSAFRISGEGLARGTESASPPLPLSLNGLELLLDGRPVPLQTVAPDHIVFQLPWETTVGAHRLEVRTDSSPLFETDSLNLEVPYDVFAQFEPLQGDRGSVSGSPYILAAHEGFGALVTRDRPARPGEVVHLYMTGLGTVDRFVPTGEAAPSDPPARITSPLACVFAPPDITTGEASAEVLFAGLAPGFAGYYQVTIRIPENVSAMYGDALLSCRPADEGSGLSGWLPVSRR